MSDAAAGIFVPVHERSIGMVFQSYAIWPHLDVFENVAYPLRVERPRLREDEITKRVTDVLTVVGMQAMANRPAPRLSGGQQQRVAFARAIVRNPSLLLLDEPLSNLDARLRDAMRRELSTLIKRIGITALFVTHDQVEALSLAEQVAVMNHGRILQEGAPAEIYLRPVNSFVAQFLGATNVVLGRADARTGDGKTRIALDCNGKTLIFDAVFQPGDLVEIALRPENLTLIAQPPVDPINTVPGTIAALTFQGNGRGIRCRYRRSDLAGILADADATDAGCLGMGRRPAVRQRGVQARSRLMHRRGKPLTRKSSARAARSPSSSPRSRLR